MKKLFHLLAVVVLLITAISFQSCSDEKYTVWIVNETNTTLGDGNYIKVEITQANWEEMAKSLTSEGRHKWDEATIKKWFISYGFGDTEATRESSWLTIVDHGFVVVRNGNIVNMILK